MKDTKFENREQLENLTENLKDRAEKIGGELCEHQENKENLEKKLERIKRRGGLTHQVQSRLEAKLREAIEQEKEGIHENQEQLRSIHQEMQKLNRRVKEGVQKMKQNRQDIQQLRQELKGNSPQIKDILAELGQSENTLQSEISFAEKIEQVLEQGLSLVGDLSSGGGYEIIKNLWGQLKGVFFWVGANVKMGFTDTVTVVSATGAILGGVVPNPLPINIDAAKESSFQEYQIHPERFGLLSGEDIINEAGATSSNATEEEIRKRDEALENALIAGNFSQNSDISP